MGQEKKEGKEKEVTESTLLCAGWSKQAHQDDPQRTWARYYTSLLWSGGQWKMSYLGGHQ